MQNMSDMKNTSLKFSAEEGGTARVHDGSCRQEEIGAVLLRKGRVGKGAMMVKDKQRDKGPKVVNRSRTAAFFYCFHFHSPQSLYNTAHGGNNCPKNRRGQLLQQGCSRALSYPFNHSFATLNTELRYANSSEQLPEMQASQFMVARHIQPLKLMRRKALILAFIYQRWLNQRNVLCVVSQVVQYPV